MRKSRMLLAASLALLPAFAAFAPHPAAASSRQPLAVEATDPHNTDHANIAQVADRCGRHRHWMDGHRDRFGHWIRGRCVENRYNRHDRY